MIGIILLNITCMLTANIEPAITTIGTILSCTMQELSRRFVVSPATEWPRDHPHRRNRAPHFCGALLVAVEVVLVTALASGPP